MGSEYAPVYRLKLPSKREVRWSPILPGKADVYNLSAIRRRKQAQGKLKEGE